MPLPTDRLEADLTYLAANYPQMLVGYHDPNFAVRFNETMDVIERVPAERRNRYVMESSLSILKGSRLHRLRDTNCAYVAPGIESWADYSAKAGTNGVAGQEKLDRVVEHFDLIGQFVGGMQANLLFGADVDKGQDPVELTKQFIRRSPRVWPTVNIPTPFGATPLCDSYAADDRILQKLPFAFYYNPYLAIILKHYSALEYYDHLIAINKVMASRRMLGARLLTSAPRTIRFIHALRSLDAARDLAAFRRIRNMLVEDKQFAAFHNGLSVDLPEFYWTEIRRRLGRYAELLTRADLTPDWTALRGHRALAPTV